MNSSREVRATTEMRVVDGVDVAEVLETVRAMSASIATEEGDQVRAHSYYVNEAERIVFVHEHYRDVEGMLIHLGLMDPDLVGRLIPAVEILDVRVYGPVNDELRQMLGAFGAPRYFDFVSGFTH